MVETFKCPNCGANLNKNEDVCHYCGTKYKVRSYKDVRDMNSDLISKIAMFYNQNMAIDMADASAGICFLALKQYDFALSKLNSAIEKNPFGSDLYMYKAIALMKGKTPFSLMRMDINKIEDCLKSGLSIKKDARTTFLWAIIRYDYFKRKCFYVSPNYKEIFDNAIALDLSLQDVEEIYELIGYRWDDIFEEL